MILSEKSATFRDHALFALAHDLTRKVCNFSGSCAGGGRTPLRPVSSEAEKMSMTAPLRVGDPTIVNVALGERAYDIVIGRGVMASLGARARALRPGAKAAIVTDDNVARLHLDAAEAALAAGGMAWSRVVVDAGEGAKSYAGLERVCEALIAARLERGDLVVALGGGVVGDLAGFAAAIVRRGLDYIQVPTTLLAQVDSAVGGKTAINSSHGKNLVGAFHQPRLVLADTATLDTLPPRQFRAGYAEVVKYALLGDAGFFAWLDANVKDVFAGAPSGAGAGGGAAREHAIATSCRMKAAIVARDERESGERALLNLGHTFGHALEAAAGFSNRLLHGEAVALGIALAADFSRQLGVLAPETAARATDHLGRAGLPVRLDEVPGDWPDQDALLDLMAQDKKVKRGKLNLILLRDIGHAYIAPDIDPVPLRAFLAEKLRPR
jgi:3-dehydroquinate synthase